MEAWPAAVPTECSVGGYSEQSIRNVASFQPDVGPSIDRRRSSVASTDVDFSTMLTTAELTDLLDWYRDTLLDGVLPFTRAHPRTLTTVVMRFKSAPRITALGGGYADGVFTVSMSAWVLS